MAESDDYLLFLDRVAADKGEVFRLPGRRQIYVIDPALAKEVLRNDDGAYREHSDFFYSRWHGFDHRSAQIETGRMSRSFLRAYLTESAPRLPQLVQQTVASGRPWPDAGNWLLYRHLADALLNDQTPAATRSLVGRIVERGVLAGAPQRYSRIDRTLFRRRAMRLLGAEIRRRKVSVDRPPADLLDVIVRCAPPGEKPAALVEVFLSFVFALTGATGFLLAWSVYLLGSNGDSHDRWPLRHVVREALRLWPVAWMFGRRPTRQHYLGDVEVTTADEVVVCAYLLQRNPRQWDHPDDFQPQRWEHSPAPDAYVPFGWGPHSCTGAGTATGLVEDILHILTADRRLSIVSQETRPQIGASLAPPLFTLRVSQANLPMRGEEVRNEDHPRCPRGDVHPAQG